MGNEPATENPYQPPQSDLRHELATPALQPLTREIATRFFIMTAASCVILSVAQVAATGFLKREYLTAQFGDLTWVRLLTSAASRGLGYAIVICISMLGSIWLFCKNQVHPPTLWKQYYCFLGIMLVVWLCGGILGLIANARGWDEWYLWLRNATIPQILFLSRNPSPEAAWFLAVETITELCGGIYLAAIPLRFAIRNRRREAIESQKSAIKKH